MDIMTALFDQDTVTRELIASKEKSARIAQEKVTKLDDIKSIMANFGITLEKAMDGLNIPVSEREYYIKEIENEK